MCQSGEPMHKDVSEKGNFSQRANGLMSWSNVQNIRIHYHALLVSQGLRNGTLNCTRNSVRMCRYRERERENARVTGLLLYK
jgi:hypothetical protein